MKPTVRSIAGKIFPAPARTTHELRSQVAAMSERLDTLERTLAYVKDYEYYKNLHPAQYRRALEEWYQTHTGRVLDLDNPQTYCEKMQWLKLYDSTPLKTRLADKYLVRQWVEEMVGSKYLVPLMGVWNSFNEIDFAALPDQFVLKCTHASGFNAIVRGKASMDLRSMESLFKQWLNINYAFWQGLELHYKDITPRILAEEYLVNQGTHLHDYRVYCFGGKPEFVQYVTGRANILPEEAVFDSDWVRQPLLIFNPPVEGTVPRPERLEELLSVASKLSEDFCAVRVDFYILDDGSIKFSEMTFTPLVGVPNFDPPEYDAILGAKIKLPSAAAL